MFSDLGIYKEVLGSDNKTQSEQRLSNISFWNIFTTETFEFYVILPLKYSFHYYGYILPKSLSQRLTRMLCWDTVVLQKMLLETREIYLLFCILKVMHQIKWLQTTQILLPTLKASFIYVTIPRVWNNLQ